MRTDHVHRRESARTGPAVLKVVPVTSAAAFASPWTNEFMFTSLFPHPLLVCINSGHIDSIGGERWIRIQIRIVPSKSKVNG